MNCLRLPFTRAAFVCTCLVALVVSPAGAAEPDAPPEAINSSSHVHLPRVLAPPAVASSFELIDAALARGAIDSETALVYKVFVISGDSRLPRQYRGTETRVFGGTGVITDAVARYPTLSPATQSILNPFLLPAYYQGSWQDQLIPDAGGLVAPRGDAPSVAPAPLGADAPADAPPKAELSPKWFFKGDDKVKVWGRKDVPGDARKMDLILSEMTATVWPKLTTLMGRLPRADTDKVNDGGDARFDIALASLDVFGITYPYDRCVKDAVHIAINRDLNDDDIRATVAHEFMHAIQFNYLMLGSCEDYQWLREATATWAEDYVYPQLNTEFLYLEPFLNYPRTPLEDRTGIHHYGAYLFPFYLSHRYNANLLRKMWEASEQPYDGGVTAVNSVIEGGFEKQWPEFVRYNWNRPPQDEYRQWDKVPRGVRAPNINVELPGRKEVELPIAGSVPHLAAQYAHYVFPDDAARSVAFYNPYAFLPDPAVKVQALLKIGGQWQPVQDWTAARGKAFCRDMKAERLEELLVIISNSSMDPDHVLQPFEPPRLVATNIGCWRWTGTATGTYESKGFWTMTTKADVTFERVRYPAGSDGTLEWEYYAPSSGTATWRLSGEGGGCTFDGGPTSLPIASSDGTMEIRNYVTRGEYYRNYSASGGQSYVFSYRVTCPPQSWINTWVSAIWLATGDTPVHVSDDGMALDGTVVAEDDAAARQSYTWHLTAQREP